MRSILIKLLEFGIQANIDRCKFHVIKTKYLKFIIGKDNIKIDFVKIKIIKNQSALKHVKDLQTFISFCNFYYWFIQTFLKIAKLLNAMTKKILYLYRLLSVKKYFKS